MTTTTSDTFNITDILRAISSAMKYPVVVVLILFVLAALVLIGWIITEYFSERRHMKISLPKLLDELQNADDIESCIVSSGLLERQKAALIELASHPQFTTELREALAIRLLDAEQERYDRITRFSDLLAKLAPMFGLLGTLIPLGPGIIALGQGDTFTLSSSLLTAFDTTVVGLLAAAAATVVSAYRKAWYGEYMSTLEVLSQCILDKEKNNTSKDAGCRGVDKSNQSYESRNSHANDKSYEDSGFYANDRVYESDDPMEMTYSMRTEPYGFDEKEGYTYE